MQNVGILKIQLGGVVKDLELNILVLKNWKFRWEMESYHHWKFRKISKIGSFWKLGLRCDAPFTIKIWWWIEVFTWVMWKKIVQNGVEMIE